MTSSPRTTDPDAQTAAYQQELVKRVSDVLMWGVSTGHHPEASIKGWAEQILKVIDHDGYLKPEAKS